MNAILVFLGAGFGGLLRYYVSVLLEFTKKSFGSFPLSTFTVNIIGSLIIGILFSFVSKSNANNTLITFLFITGFLGGFTTFSSFSLDFIKLFQRGEIILAFIYVFASLSISFLFTFLGYSLFKIFKF